MSSTKVNSSSNKTKQFSPLKRYISDSQLFPKSSGLINELLYLTSILPLSHTRVNNDGGRSCFFYIGYLHGRLHHPVCLGLGQHLLEVQTLDIKTMNQKATIHNLMRHWAYQRSTRWEQNLREGCNS